MSKHLTPLVASAALLGLLVVLPSVRIARGAEARPNILVAFADDWGRYASIYGQLKPGGPNDLVSTPNFDRLARDGVLFTHAFVNAPSCTPCRSAFLSGQYFWRTGRGAILQGAEWDASIPSFPLLLRDAGYHIGYSHKVWSPGTPANAPYGAAETAYADRGNLISQFSEQLSAADDPKAARQQILDEVRGNFDDFLAARQDGVPFCYWFGPTNTHRKWIQGSGRALWGLNPDDLKGKVPAFLPDVETVREDIADYLGEVQAFDAALGVVLDRLDELGEADRTLVAVSGDHGMPGVSRGKCNLYDFGVGVSLAIRYPQKVPGGRVVDDFVCLPDLAPTFLEAGGLTPPAVMTGRSLMPVLSSASSGQVDPSRDFAIVGRERHVAAARTDNLPYPQRAIHTRDFLYIRNFQPERWPMGTAAGHGEPDGAFPSYEDLREDTFLAFSDMDASPTKAWIITHRDDPGMDRYFDFAFGRRPGEELYDLKSDPDCLKNLADDSAFADKKQQLAERLMSVLTQTGDPRVTGDTGTFDRPPFSDPYEDAARPRRNRNR
jgi:uncharacterized sulfatase